MRMLFLYNHDHTKEAEDFASGKVPSHRLFGLMDVRRLDHASTFFSTPKLFRSLKQKPLLWRVLQALYALQKQHGLDCIIATHEASALPVLILKQLGLLRIPLIVVNVALLSPTNTASNKKRLWNRLLPHADGVVSYASGQSEGLRRTYGIRDDKLLFIPLGVDTLFFKQTTDACTSDYGISVGTNEGKDYVTLISALPPGARWIIVTDEHNARIIEKCQNTASCIEVHQAVPIDQLREWYQGARMHVIPLHETEYSTGQTVLLENMAIGKIVVVSRTSAVTDYVEEDVTALVVPPEDVASLRNTILNVWNDPGRYAHIGQAAAMKVREHFSAHHFATRLVTLVEGIIEKRR